MSKWMYICYTNEGMCSFCLNAADKECSFCQGGGIGSAPHAGSTMFKNFRIVIEAVIC